MYAKREGNSDSCYNVDEPEGRAAQRSKPGTKIQMLRDSPDMRDLESQIHRDKKWNGGRARGCGEGKRGGVVFRGDSVSVLQDGSFLKIVSQQCACPSHS